MLRLRAVLRCIGVKTVNSDGEVGGRQLSVERGQSRSNARWSQISLTSTEFELLRFTMHTAERIFEQGSDPGPGAELRFRRPLQHRLAVHLLPMARR